MIHWIAFDDDTAEGLVSRLCRGAAKIEHNPPIDAALRVEGKSIMVLPSPMLGKLLIARFNPKKGVQFPTGPAAKTPIRSLPPANTSPAPKRMTAGSEKKPWWRNIVA